MNSLIPFSKLLVITSLIAGSASLAALEANPGSMKMPPAPLPVQVENPGYTFGMHFVGLAMQPYANNLDYGAEALPFNYGDAQPAVSPSWLIPTISTDYHFGFDVGIAGVFHCANSSLSLNWERYHSPTDSSSLAVDNASYMIGTFFEIGPDASVYKKATGTVKFHFDEVNLNYGTFVRFGELLEMNLFTGVSFGRIVQHRFTTLSDLPERVIRTLDVPTKFTGAGPQLGIDFKSKIYKGLQFVGNTRGSLYVGTFKNSTTYTTSSYILQDLNDINPNVQTTMVYNKGGIVPGFEGKLGFAYEYLFQDNYLFQIEVGYQAQIYLNAIRSIDMGSEVTLASGAAIGSAATGVYARTFDRTVSDFALAGPYATANFAF